MAPRAIDLNARSNYGGPEVETHDFALEMIFAEVPCACASVHACSVRPSGWRCGPAAAWPWVRWGRSTEAALAQWLLLRPRFATAVGSTPGGSKILSTTRGKQFSFVTREKGGARGRGLVRVGVVWGKGLVRAGGW